MSSITDIRTYEQSMEDVWREDTRRAYETIESMGERVRLLSEDDVLEVLEGAMSTFMPSPTR
jgi:hypothetical protein